MNIRLNKAGRELINHKCTINEIPQDLTNYDFLIKTISTVLEQMKNQYTNVTDEEVALILNTDLSEDDFYEDLIQNENFVLSEKEWKEIVESIISKINDILEPKVESIYKMSASENLDIIYLKLNLTTNLEDMVGFLYFIDPNEDKNIEDYGLELSKKGIQRIFSYRSQRAYESSLFHLDSKNSVIKNLESIKIKKEDIDYDREDNVYRTTITVSIDLDYAESIIEGHKVSEIENNVNQLAKDINDFLSHYKKIIL